MIFDSIKLYKGEILDYDNIFRRLVEYGYRPCAKVREEGDFSKRGEIIDIFPITFEYPLRLELTDKKLEKVRSFDINTGKAFEDHTVVIILPISGIQRRRVSVKPPPGFDESPIESFVDIQSGDYVVHIDHGIGIYRGIEKLKKTAGTRIISS